MRGSGPTTGDPAPHCAEFPPVASKAFPAPRCPSRSSGGITAALAGVRQAAARRELGSGDTVVLVSTAHGLKFTEFKVRYHEGTLPDAESRRANRPTTLPGNADAVRRALDQSAGVST